MAVSTFVKKTMWINRNYLGKAVRIFNARSEKEAVNRALELAVEEEAIIEAHNAIRSAGTIEEVIK